MVKNKSELDVEKKLVAPFSLETKRFKLFFVGMNQTINY
jgi:hypothetical protein